MWTISALITGMWWHIAGMAIIISDESSLLRVWSNIKMAQQFQLINTTIDGREISAVIRNLGTTNENCTSSINSFIQFSFS